MFPLRFWIIGVKDFQKEEPPECYPPSLFSYGATSPSGCDFDPHLGALASGRPVCPGVTGETPVLPGYFGVATVTTSLFRLSPPVLTAESEISICTPGVSGWMVKSRLLE